MVGEKKGGGAGRQEEEEEGNKKEGGSFLLLLFYLLFLPNSPAVLGAPCQAAAWRLESFTRVLFNELMNREALLILIN